MKKPAEDSVPRHFEEYLFLSFVDFLHNLPPSLWPICWSLSFNQLNNLPSFSEEWLLGGWQSPSTEFASPPKLPTQSSQDYPVLSNPGGCISPPRYVSHLKYEKLVVSSKGKVHQSLQENSSCQDWVFNVHCAMMHSNSVQNSKFICKTVCYFLNCAVIGFQPSWISVSAKKFNFTLELVLRHLKLKLLGRFKYNWILARDSSPL